MHGVKEETMHGPIDYIIVSFKDNKFDGSILSSLQDAISKDILMY